MKKHYDFSKSVKNPYLRKPKKQLTIRLGQGHDRLLPCVSGKERDSVSELINLYLRDCAQSDRKLSMKWE